MDLSTFDYVVSGVAAGVLIFTLLFRYLSRRNLCRRLGALCARVGDEDAGLEVRSVESGFATLERMVDARVATVGEATAVSERLANCLALLDTGVIVTNEIGAVVVRNPAAVALLGGDRPDPGAEAAVVEMLMATVNGLPQDHPVAVGDDGRVRVVTHALENDHRAVGAVAIIHDFSERHRLEAIRRDFVANISHELKTPVGALSLLAETLTSEVDPMVSQRLSRRLLIEARRVARVVDDLIELTRIQGEEEPQREPVAVHLVVAQAAERVRSLAQDREMTINFGEPPQRLWVYADRRQLVTAVFNLIENAVKFSATGSVVEVRARPDRDMVELSVSDQGVGIPERDHERIFERFYRVDHIRAGDGGGTGLGLALVRNVVDNHDGEVIVESGEGQGSTFTLRLPAADPVPVSPARAG